VLAGGVATGVMLLASYSTGSGGYTYSVTGDALYRRYLAAQLERDRAAALRVVLDDGLGAGVAVPDLYLGVIQRAQHEIGRLWQANRVSVAEEHIATGISQLAVSLLYPSLPRAPANGRHALVACVGGEWHDLGARMVADFYEMAGFSVRYLGANVPVDGLVAMVREDPPDLLALSVTMTFNADALRLAVEGVRDAVGDTLRLAVGGHACSWAPGLGRSVGADVCEPDVRDAVRRSATVLAGEHA
jgi:methanogenic corrinoid protein MtbC1